jgi:hypothetical protein
MPARAIRDADADYSFLDKQCSFVINCCSFGVRFPAIRQRQTGGRREGDHGAADSIRARTAAHLCAASADAGEQTARDGARCPPCW